MPEDKRTDFVLTQLYPTPRHESYNSYSYDVRSGRVALHLHADGNFTRWSCGSLRVRGRCPGVVDGLLGRFGAGGFTYMQGAPIGASEGGGDALLSFEDPSNGVPTRVLAGFAQPSSDELYELAGDDGDEQMSFGADGLVVEDGSQSELRFQRAEDSLEVGEGDMGSPQGFLVPIGLIAAQAIHPRMGHHRALDRAASEAHRGGALGAVVGIEFDVVVLGDAVVFRLVE